MVAVSSTPGTVAPPAPPAVALQLAVLLQLPLRTPLTQNRVAPHASVAGSSAPAAAAPAAHDIATTHAPRRVVARPVVVRSVFARALFARRVCFPTRRMLRLPR